MTRSPRSTRRPRRSNYEAKSCMCPFCKVDVELPNPECPTCHSKCTSRFDFNILRFHKNGKSHRTRVYDQGNSGLCAMYACKSLVEIKARIERADMDWYVDPDLDTKDMLDEYAVEARAPFGKEERHCQGEFRVKTMLKVFKIKDISTTSKDNFSKICELLANGDPLLGAFYAGQNFGDLEDNKVYKSPPQERMSNVRLAHAVCIVGAGARKEGGQLVRYLWFRNSYGKSFGRRGDGMVRFSDLMFDPYIISLKDL